MKHNIQFSTKQETGGFLGVERGFALLEALIAMLLFSVGILGMVAMQARAAQFSTDSEDRSRAALAANEIASWMFMNQTSTVTAAAQSSWQSLMTTQGSLYYLPGASGTVSAPDANGVVTVTVKWTAIDVKGASSVAASSSGSAAATGNRQYVTQVVVP